MNERLHDAIFGGPGLSPSEAEAWVARLGVVLPALVVAGEGEELVPGVRFRFMPCSVMEAPPPHYLGEARRLVYALQGAIVQERKGQLAGATQRGWTPREEAEAFALAVQEARRGQAGEAVALWVEVVLGRHHLRINAVRLRWVEFLAALTRGSEADLAYTSYALVREVYREASLPRLAELPRRMVEEIAPLVAGRLPALQASGAHPALPKALAVMEARFAERLGLREVAKACHISPEHLARVFKAATGQSVVAYLQRLRVNRARELLATTSLPLLEVALAAGFESVEHFHRLFKRQCGVTPRAYRLRAGAG